MSEGNHQFHAQNAAINPRPAFVTRTPTEWVYGALISLYFVFSSFTWSYIFSIGDILIRPFDIVSIILIFATLLARRIPLQTDIVFIYGVIVSLCLYLYAYGIVSSSTTPVISATKIIYLTTASFAAGLIIDQYHRRFRLIHFSATFILLLLVAIVANPDLVENVRGVFASKSSQSVPDIANQFWRTVFQTNLFGQSENLISRGLSFRNSAALGAFSMILFVSGFMPRTKGRTVMLLILSIVSFGLFSRTCWFLLCAFFVTRLLFRRNKIVAIFSVTLVVASISFSLPSIYHEIVEDRLYSESNRIDQYAAGLALMSEKPFVGHGPGTTITYAFGDISVHNVFIALGVNYGIVALFLALVINFICLFFALNFLYRLATVRTTNYDDTIHCQAMAALALFVVPHVSSSVENLLSFGGWACFAIFVSGLLTYQRRPRTLTTT